MGLCLTFQPVAGQVGEGSSLQSALLNESLLELPWDGDRDALRLATRKLGAGRLRLRGEIRATCEDHLQGAILKGS